MGKEGTNGQRREVKRDREGQTRRENRERENERTNEFCCCCFLINEGTGISTILFLHPALGAKQEQNNNNKSNRKQ